ncbi:MAG: hypothetical protein ACFFD4_31620 [Candidatus Odinarchaeota archaeon]
MFQVIDQLWVILANGICAVYKDYTGLVKKQETINHIFAGFSVVICKMAEILDKGHIRVIELEKRSIHYFSQSPSHIIAVVTNTESKDEDVQEFLKNINHCLLETCNLENITFIKHDDLVLFESRLDSLVGPQGRVNSS